MWQVLANGGVGAACALLYKLTGNPAWAVGFAVSFASSNADTWASELGVLSRLQPVSILSSSRDPGSFRRSQRAGKRDGSRGSAVDCGGVWFGRSRGRRVSAAGVLRNCRRVCGITVGQLPGGDRSGAIRGRRGKELTELKRGADGQPNRLVRGLAFVNNDVVNATSCFRRLFSESLSVGVPSSTPLSASRSPKLDTKAGKLPQAKST